MYNNSIDKSSESLSEDNIFTSQNTQNKSQNFASIKIQTKETNVLSNQNSNDEDLIKNKMFVTPNELISPQKRIMNNIDLNEVKDINEINNINKKTSLALSLSPLKKKRRNFLVDIMEKSKKNTVRRRSVINLITPEEQKFRDEIIKVERRDAYGMPINKKNKRKVKVTFSDTVNNKTGQKQLAEVIPIASFKKYNYIDGFPREEDIVGNKSTCQCCLIN